MKKLFKGIFCAVLCGAAILGAVACGGKENTNDPTDGGTSEPTFEIAGDLQALYGTDGYPQAVLVAKTSVIESDEAAVAAMISYMEGADGYLASAQPADVVALLNDKYPTGVTPSLNAKNLNAQVIKNCSVKFSAASEKKTLMNAYLQKLIGVQADSTKIPDDAFYYQGGAKAGEITGHYEVYAPDGAPALALANAIHEGNSAFTYHVVASATIAAQVTGQSPAADFCVLPSNVAAKLLGNGEIYKMLGVVTNGNLYFIRTNTAQKKLTDQTSLSALVGKKVGVVQLANVPGLTLQAVLKDAGVPYQILESASAPAADDKVNLVAFADATTVGPAAGCDYYLCPEPAATAKTSAFQASKS